MSEHFFGAITVGGKVRRSLIPGLIQAINEQNCSPEWGDAYLDIPNPSSPEAEAKLLECVAREGASSLNGRLWLSDHQARNGEFGIVERYCQEHGIAFRRFSEACGDYDPEVVEFRPGMEGLLQYLTDADGNEMMPASIVREFLSVVLEDGHLSAKAITVPPKKGLKWLEKEILKLGGELSPVVPDLEPFEIVEG